MGRFRFNTSEFFLWITGKEDKRVRDKKKGKDNTHMMDMGVRTIAGEFVEDLVFTGVDKYAGNGVDSQWRK